jgi:hypothetical protein
LISLQLLFDKELPLIPLSNISRIDTKLLAACYHLLTQYAGAAQFLVHFPVAVPAKSQMAAGETNHCGFLIAEKALLIIHSLISLTVRRRVFQAIESVMNFEDGFKSAIFGTSDKEVNFLIKKMKNHS